MGFLFFENAQFDISATRGATTTRIVLSRVQLTRLTSAKIGTKIALKLVDLLQSLFL